MKWKLSLPEPELVLYFFAKSFGLAPFTVKNKTIHPPSRLSQVYSFSLAVIYFLLFPMLVNPWKPALNPGNYSSLARVGTAFRHFMGILSMFPTLMIFLTMYKKILDIFDKLCFISDELKSLGIGENRDKMFKHLLVNTLTVNAFMIAILVTMSLMESEWPFFMLIKFAIDNLFKLNSILIFAHMLLFIKQRFALVNEHLYNEFRPASPSCRSLRHLRMFSVIRNLPEEFQTEIEYLTDVQRMRKIEALHMELCDLVDRTTQIFAIPISFNSLQFCTELMLASFKIYFTIHEWNLLCVVTGTTSCATGLACVLLRAVCPVIDVLLITHASVKTSREGNDTRNVLSEVWDNSKSPELQDEFFTFSLQLKHMPVSVSVFGFLDLDYSYLYQIICATVAYLIVMIQFDTS